jgi:fatty-acyl-CoA synthase
MLRSIDGASLPALIARALAGPADRLAMTDSEGVCTLGEVAALVRRALAGFAALGLKPGDAVAQLSRNRVRMWAVMAACYLGGTRSVTLHPLGGLADQRFIIRDCGARLLLTDAAFHARGAELAAPQHMQHDAGAGCFWDMLPEDPGGDWPAPPDPETVVRIAYTGGTTGRPKGVMLSGRALAWNSTVATTAIDWPLVPRFLCVAPISHGSGSLLLPVLLKGGVVHLRPGFAVADMAEAGRRFRTNATWLVPTMLKALVEAEEPMPDFETIIWSGAAAGPVLLEAALRRFGPVLTGCYGQTEAPNVITILGKADHDPARPDLLASVGRATEGTEIAVRDAAGRPCPAGEAGEVHVAGPLLMSGYLGMEAETARVMREGWLATGDVGRLDADGVLTLVDRAKDMIISGGFNIYPAEVEAALLSHPDVAEAAVVGRPDPHWGEAAVAFLVLREGRAADEAALKAHVRARKGPVLVPKDIRFVDALPRTALGKTDRKALRAMLGG